MLRAGLFFFFWFKRGKGLIAIKYNDKRLVLPTNRRVHISEVTLSFINDEYEVEPGEGEKRSDYIRSSGLKTYLIKIPNKQVMIYVLMMQLL